MPISLTRVLSIADLTDIIDTQVCTCTGGSKADAIGIAIPGAIDDGMFDLGLRTAFDLGEGDLANRLRDAREFDMARFFNERYDIPVFLCNNSNAAALGWYASQDEYENVTLHSQPAGWAVGGQGNVVNGRLVEGAHSIAGEIRHITDRLQYRHPLHFNAYDPADVLDMVAQMLAVACTTYDPEVIALRCDILPDMDEVAEELARYIPRDRQPKLVHVDNYNECILLGMMVRCLQLLSEKDKHTLPSWKIDITNEYRHAL